MEKTHFGQLAQQAPNFRSRRYFKDPNGQNLDVYVRKLLLKFQDDPTVNESGMGFLPTHVL